MQVAAQSPSATASVASSLRAALRRMQDAQRKSGAPSYEERVLRLDRLERAVRSRKGEMASAISSDFGNRSTHESLLAEVFLLLGAINHARAHLRDWMEKDEREVPWVFLPARAEVLAQPLGVVGIIAPWNYPVLLALSPLVGALAAGNRAMIKPSELVPQTAEWLRGLIADTFAEDEVAVFTGGPEVGEAFSRLPFDHLVFTGSTRVGKLVMRAASENLVPLTLELGGKSPAIVGAGFSLRLAAQRIMSGKLFSAGQTCIAPDYVMVQEAARDELVQAFKESVDEMYPSLAANPDYTSIVNDEHHARLKELVDDARARGAQVVELSPAAEPLQGSRKFVPTLVLGPTAEMRVLQEEIFGPILPVVTYDALAEAVAFVNDRPRPLALYFFSHDRAAIERVLAETMSGGVTINDTMFHIAQDDLPFGGVGSSGMGHYHAREGFETFTKKKAVFRQARFNATGLLRPPYGKRIERLLAFLVGR